MTEIGEGQSENNRIETLAQYVKLGFSSPSLAFRKLSQGYNRVKHGAPYNTNGLDVMATDWDNLIVLDACRYDLFVEHNTIDGELSKVVSRGSATPEWLAGNFTDKQYWDTVYVTGNPMLFRNRDEVNVEFHDVIEVWQGDGWDDDEGTVRPETMANAVREAAEAYPNKRLLCHFMQPHYPFIGDDGGFGQGFIGNEDGENLEPWLQIKTGRVDLNEEAVWEAYGKNLSIALPIVSRLVDDLSGKSVITSDHGNMFGERSRPIPAREWGHPPGIYTDELVQVPWLECPTKERKEIRAERKHDSESNNRDSEDVQSRLESLGYLE